jgi:uncharacterized membrane protein YqiK
MNISQQKLMTIIVLVAVLLAGVAAFWIIMPSAPSSDTLVEANTVNGNTVAPSPEANANFNTTVLQRSDYTTLDLDLVKQGRLPVPPPLTAGKPNPF